MPTTPPKSTELVTLAFARRNFPQFRVNDRLLHLSTLTRLATRGVLSRGGKRVILRTVQVAGRTFTRAEWCSQFGDQVNDVAPAAVSEGGVDA